HATAGGRMAACSGVSFRNFLGLADVLDRVVDRAIKESSILNVKCKLDDLLLSFHEANDYPTTFIRADQNIHDRQPRMVRTIAVPIANQQAIRTGNSCLRFMFTLC